MVGCVSTYYKIPNKPVIQKVKYRKPPRGFAKNQSDTLWFWNVHIILLNFKQYGISLVTYMWPTSDVLLLLLLLFNFFLFIFGA